MFVQNVVHKVFTETFLRHKWRRRTPDDYLMNVLKYSITFLLSMSNFSNRFVKFVNSVCVGLLFLLILAVHGGKANVLPFPSPALQLNIIKNLEHFFQVVCTAENHNVNSKTVRTATFFDRLADRISFFFARLRRALAKSHPKSGNPILLGNPK